MAHWGPDDAEFMRRYDMIQNQEERAAFFREWALRTLAEAEARAELNRANRTLWQRFKRRVKGGARRDT